MWLMSVRPKHEEDGGIGRDWRDKNIKWILEEYKEQDGYTLVAFRMLAQLGLEKNKELS